MRNNSYAALESKDRLRKMQGKVKWEINLRGENSYREAQL